MTMYVFTPKNKMKNMYLIQTKRCLLATLVVFQCLSGCQKTEPQPRPQSTNVEKYVTPDRQSIAVESTKQPNIILILADDMGYSDLGVMGSEIPTPNLDQLANNGLLFTQFYNTARCSTTRASLLTGRYSHKTGIGHLDDDQGYPGYRGFLNKNTPTIAEVLKERGYRTILSGKWHIGKERAHWPDKRGFERFYGIPAGGGIYFYPSQFLDRPIYKNGKQVVPDDPSFYSTRAFTDEALGFIDEAQQDKKPFFLYLAHIAPHFPLQAPEAYTRKHLGKYRKNYQAIRAARFAKQVELGIVPKHTELSPKLRKVSKDRRSIADRKMAVYAAQVEILDETIGRLTQSLKQKGLYDNTLILFLSDNGAASSGVDYKGEGEIGSKASFVAYGKHWANVSNTPYREYKKFVHEGGIITPLIMHWPAGIAKPRQVNKHALHVIDIMPTLLEITDAKVSQPGVEHPVSTMDGVSFAPLLAGSPLASERLLFWEHEGNAAVRQQQFKAVKKRGAKWELYDLKQDPTELKNLARQQPQKLNVLIKAYQNWATTNKVLPWPIKDKM